jgi:hypothetical protein
MEIIMMVEIINFKKVINKLKEWVLCKVQQRNSKITAFRSIKIRQIMIWGRMN